jgi:hypothetical protein
MRRHTRFREALRPTKMRVQSSVTSGVMALSFHPGKARAGIRWMDGLLGIVAVFALLVGRSVPPDFASASVLHSSVIHTFASHHQRPRFNCDASKWTVPANFFVALPPAGEAAPIGLSPQLFSNLQTKGFHYNRPPPAV